MRKIKWTNKKRKNNESNEVKIPISILAFCPAAKTTSTGSGANEDQKLYLASAISPWIPVSRHNWSSILQKFPRILVRKATMVKENTVNKKMSWSSKYKQNQIMKVMFNMNKWDDFTMLDA